MSTGFSATEPDEEGPGGVGGLAVDLEKIAAGVRLILEGIGEDAGRAGLLRTPEYEQCRAAAARAGAALRNVEAAAVAAFNSWRTGSE